MLNNKLLVQKSQWRAEIQNGESLHFELCKGGYFSNKEEYGLKVVGKTFQEGTPTPETPIPIQCIKAGTKVTVCGKNLCPRFSSKTINGITFNANVDGSVTVNGTAVNTATTDAIPITLDAGTYTKTSGKKDVYLIGYYFNEDNTVRYLSDIFTLAEPKKVMFYLQIYKNSTVKNVTFYPQVEKGSKQTAYEPYFEPQVITIPCDLYEDDIWYSITGKVERYSKARVLDENVGVNMNANEWFNVWIRAEHKQKTSKSSHYKRVAAYSSEALNNTNHFQDDINSNYLYFKLEQTTIEEVKNYWQSQKEQGMPVTIVYELEIPVIEQYDPQPIFALQGTVNVKQEPIELSANLSATMFVKR